jgi:hypothetical protein
MKLIKKDIIDKAVAILKGYCIKHPDCTKCRFCKNGNCSLEDLPCDWSNDND